MPKVKRSKVWLHFTSKDADSAACNKCSKAILCKGGTTSNLIKHLTTHGIFLKAEQCTIFDSLRDPAPSTSSAAIGASSIPREESPTPSPASVIDATDDDSSRSSSDERKVKLKSLQLYKCLFVLYKYLPVSEIFTLWCETQRSRGEERDEEKGEKRIRRERTDILPEKSVSKYISSDMTVIDQ
ncbi:hypothetical protein ABVT39_008878 [Epinephelus coioides]